MMKAVLKTLVISFGGGLALGAGIRLTQGPKRKEAGVNLDPLLARLKNVESRIIEIEAVPHLSTVAQPSAVAESTLAAFESRLAAQVGDVEQVRAEVRRVDQRLGELDAQLPVIVQSTVDVRFHEVERKLQQDFEEAQSRSMAAFVDTLQTKVVERINTLETNLAQQSQAIGKLRDTSVRTDESLQKMLLGIEKLVDQTRQAPPPPPTQPPAGPGPAAVVPPAVQASAAELELPVARTAVAEKPESLAAHLANVRLEAAVQETNNGHTMSEAAALSDAHAVADLPDDIPVLARIPEIGHVVATEAVRTASVPEREAAPAVAVAEEPVAPAALVSTEIPAETPPLTETPLKSEESYEWVNRIGLELLAPRPKPRPGWRIPLAVGLVAGLILVVGLLYSGALQRFFDSTAPQPPSTLASTAPGAEAPPAPPKAAAPAIPKPAANPGDVASLVEQGREYTRRKDWSKAEAAFRSALDASPGNRDAALGLSDVLYQEQKYEESAAVLNKLSSARAQ
jgi:uncharacterized coiled-coil protein SlyX